MIKTQQATNKMQLEDLMETKTFWLSLKPENSTERRMLEDALISLEIDIEDLELFMKDIDDFNHIW